MKIEYWKVSDRWYWRAVGSNGRVMITKQGGYVRPAFLKKSIASLGAGMRAAKLVEVTK